MPRNGEVMIKSNGKQYWGEAAGRLTKVLRDGLSEWMLCGNGLEWLGKE